MSQLCTSPAKFKVKPSSLRILNDNASRVRRKHEMMSCLEIAKRTMLEIVESLQQVYEEIPATPRSIFPLFLGRLV